MLSKLSFKGYLSSIILLQTITVKKSYPTRTKSPLSNAGFTLIETLVASAIFSTVAIAYIGYLNTAIKTSYTLLDKKQAMIVADNTMVQVKLCMDIPKTKLVQFNQAPYLYTIKYKPHTTIKNGQWVTIEISPASNITNPTSGDTKPNVIGQLVYVNSTTDCLGYRL